MFADQKERILRTAEWMVNKVFEAVPELDQRRGQEKSGVTIQHHTRSRSSSENVL